MLTKRIIPCLDVADGRVVKGVQFLGLRDAGDPVEIARRYDAEGADELVFLDIQASTDNRNTMLDVVSRTAEQVFMPLCVGGGIRETWSTFVRRWWKERQMRPWRRPSSTFRNTLSRKPVITLQNMAFLCDPSEVSRGQVLVLRCFRTIVEAIDSGFPLLRYA